MGRLRTEYLKQYHIDNKERLNAQARECYQLNKEKIKTKHKIYNDVNKDKLAIQKKEYAKLNAEKISLRQKLWYQNNKDMVKTQQQFYLSNNLDKFRLKTAKRRALLLSQTPNWNCEFNEFAIEEIYALAALRTELTHVKWDVDHIIPLKGKKVRGLHVANNLQVITSLENKIKANKYEVSL